MAVMRAAAADFDVAPSRDDCCWSHSLDMLFVDDPLDFSSTCIGEADRYQTTAHQQQRLGRGARDRKSSRVMQA